MSLDRRGALELLAAGMALGLAGCDKPEEEIVPYVDMPERLVPGVPLRFATTLPLAGYGRGAVAVSREGRPIKVEGNPRHPASLGATDVFAEAAVLGLYDPDRSQAVREQGGIASWDAFLTALLPRLEGHAADGGAGLRLLTGRVTSPTLLRQIEGVRQHFPNARWHRHEAVHDDNERQGARLAFGRVFTALPDLGAARVIIALDADPLGVGPDQIRHGRGYGRQRTVRRRANSDSVARLYAIESLVTLTGASADHRLPLAPGAVSAAATLLAASLGAGLPRPALPEAAVRFVEAAARDLDAHRGQALVLIGRGQPAEVQALGHWLNARLEAPVRLVEPVDPVPEDHAASLAALVDDMRAGRVGTLVTLDANPVYDAPADLGFADALAAVPFSVHLGLHRNETARGSRWHLPASHPLEAWSDLRATDGTASIVQPLIRPLYTTRTAHEVVAFLMGGLDTTPHELVRETWRARAPAGDFEAWWRQALHDGVIAGTAAPAATAPTPALPPPVDVAAADRTLVIQPDPAVWDGAFANNAWLQECPKPLTKQVWGNALLMAPADLEALGLVSGDLARVEAGGRSITGPVMEQPGQAPGVVGLTLGYGRRAAGRIGDGLGVDAFALRTSLAPWVVEGVAVSAAGGRQPIVRTQHEFEEHGREEILPVVSLADLARGAELSDEREPPSFFPKEPEGEHAWAMVIDTTLCIGCNACVVACQAENNIPVVGPEEVARGREMHWLRIDAYRTGDTPADPRPAFQPVPCMHCEQAPCEPVCPVAASVHDHEGLNVQVYNRCVGTRFCQANCPYKVRRFNFFAYANGQEYANLGEEVVWAQRNPEVTVRARGVMEKCTYCVQRISRARIDAEREGRAIGDGEVVTACAAACPTRAITFGDLKLEGSAVNRLRREPQHYALLGHLGTRPRTTYLARVRNPNPELEGGDA